ncbi:MAG: hypothetical protein K2W82_17925 [Candidatus Obscuribacterales bacterium]|nr:hypothetical protein [Candidatus Obscuribacterales bacterium]
METEVVEISADVLNSPALKKRVELRRLSMDEFIERHASGTLRKNKRIGFAVQNHYLHERVAYEFGWGFEILHRSRVTFGDAFSEGDCSAVTESGWHAERYLTMSIFPEDYFELKFLHIEKSEHEKQAGIGLVVRQTSAPWVPKGHLVYALIAESIPRKGEQPEHYLPAQNPF